MSQKKIRWVQRTTDETQQRQQAPANPGAAVAATPSAAPAVQEPAQEPQQPTMGQQAHAETSRLARRFKRQGVPFAAIGGTHAIGGIAASLSGPSALLPVAAGWAAAGGGYAYVHRHASRWDRVYTAAAAAASASAQLMMAATGADGPAAWATWAVGGLLAVPWWKRHTEPDPDVTAELTNPQPAAPAPPDDEPDPRSVTWGKHLGNGNGALPGSKLRNIADFEFGWTATVEHKITHHWEEVMQARKTILSVYDLPDARVYIERKRGESVRCAHMTVLTSDPLQKIRQWPGPGLDPTTGGFPIMTTADGQTLNFRFWSPGQGVLHSLISGSTGSGKSKVLDLILSEAQASDRIYPVVIDGGKGGSLPNWMDRVPVSTASRDGARAVLRWALTVMESRVPLLKKQGGGSLEPSPDVPLVPVVIDEAHKLLMSDDDEDNRDIARMCEKIAQEGRKYGVALILATQVPSAKQLGGSTVIRDQMKAGTVIGLRVNENTSGNMITSGSPMPEKLNELPQYFDNGEETRGLGYMLTHRMIRSRALLITDAQVAASRDVTVELEPTARAVTMAAASRPDGASDTAHGGPGNADRHLQPVDDTETPQDVRAAIDAAIEAGSPTDVASLMRNTGLGMKTIRAALAEQR